jgi:hypothetical protein
MPRSQTLKRHFLSVVVLALLLYASAESRSATGSARSPQVSVGVWLQIVDACGVASQTAGAQLRCRSTMARAAGSVSAGSPALVSVQWCRREEPAGASAQQAVCSEVRAPDSDQQLIFTF